MLKKLKKPLLFSSLVLAFAIAGHAEAAERLPEDYFNGSYWSVVPYSKDATHGKPSDRIIVNNIFTKYRTMPGTEWPEKERSALDHIQSWEMTLKYSSGKIGKIVGSDLDPSNHELRGLLKWDDQKYNNELIYSSYIDMRQLITARYLSSKTNDVFTIFANSYVISDDMYAQVKGMKMRADWAWNRMREIGQEPNKTRIEEYDRINAMYEMLTHIYNGQADPNYLPQLLIDIDADFTEQERTDMISALNKMPLPLRRVFVRVLVIGAENVAPNNMQGILGLAGNDRRIRLNGMYNETIGTLTHEVGHTVDFMSAYYENANIVNTISRLPEFLNIHREDYKNEWTYIKDLPAEGFAEGFGRWIQYKYLGVDADTAFKKIDENARIYFDILGEELFGPEHAPRTYKPDIKFSIGVREPVKETPIEEPPAPQPEPQVKKENVTVTNRTIVYQANPKVDAGVQSVLDEGADKVIEKTTTTHPDGRVETTERTVSEMRPRVIAVGTKTKVVQSKVPYATTYITVKGKKGVHRKGVDGAKTTTTTYTVNAETGRVIGHSKVVITKRPVVEVRYK